MPGTGFWEPRLTLTGARAGDENIREARGRTETFGEKTTITFSNNFALADAHRA